MKQEEFMAAVLAQIRHATPEERTAITAELTAHLEDHAESLTDCGYSPEEAEKRALDAMGEPEAIGHAMNRLYPLGWLILSRVTVLVTALLCATLLLTWPMLGNLVSNLEAQLSPMGGQRELDCQVVEQLDVRRRINSDIWRVYAVGLDKTTNGGLVTVAMCNYDRNPFGQASYIMSNYITVVTAAEEQLCYGSGSSDGGRSSTDVEDIPVTAGEEYVTLVYDAFGRHEEIRVPVPWEELP